jgi:hypothetical protein
MKEGEGGETSTVHDKKRQHGTNVQKMEGEGEKQAQFMTKKGSMEPNKIYIYTPY